MHCRAPQAGATGLAGAAAPDLTVRLYRRSDDEFELLNPIDKRCSRSSFGSTVAGDTAEEPSNALFSPAQARYAPENPRKRAAPVQPEGVFRRLHRRNHGERRPHARGVLSALQQKG